MAIGAFAQETLTVYDGTTTSSYVPMYGGYFDDFTRTQFVIPAEDLTDMEGGQISEIKFYTNSQNVPYTTVSSVDVYLMEVDYTSISAYEAKADAQIVYSGFIEFVSADGGGETTITFESPYTYNGGNLLIGCENTTDAGYKFIYFYGQTVNNASISASNSSSLANVTPTQRNFIPKTTFTYTPGAPASCPRPTELAKSNLTARTVDLAWTNGADETAWQIYISNAPGSENIIDVTTNPYTLTDLTPETTYLVKVRANCGSEQSNWSNTINFTTLVSCPAPANLTCTAFTATTATLSWDAGDSEGEWNLQYKAAADADWTVENDVTSPYTITGLTEETNYVVQVQAVCDVDDLSAWTSPVLVYTGYCQPAPTSRDGKGITGVSFGFGDDVVNNSDDNGLPTSAPYYGNYASMVGAVEAGVEAAVNITFYTSGGWSSYDYATIIWIDLNNNLSFEGNEVVYVGTSEVASPTTLAATFTLPASTPAGDYRMRIAAADSYYDNYVGSIAAAADANTCPTGSYTVVHDYTIRVNEAPACMRPSGLQVSNITASGADLAWIPGDTEEEWQICLNNDEEHLITADANGYTLTGLDDLTEYTVKVRAYCSAEEQSAWITTTFTTLSSCPVPEDVEVSDITSYTANISWTAEANADSYIVRYRALTPVIDEGFENGIPATWTTIDADGDGNNWLALSEIPSTYTSYSEIPSWAHSGSDAATSSSFANGVGGFNSDHWLISPQIDLGGVINLYVGSTDADQDSYEVLLSTTGNETTDFSVTLRSMAEAPNGDWDEISIDLSGYAGQQGYIAIHHVSTSMYFLVVDDFSIYSIGEWVEADATTETSAVISNLAANTSYQYQVASVCGSDDDNWSASGSFTTLVSCLAPTNLTESNVTAHAATLSWTPTGNEEAWQISVGGDEENLISSESNSYDLANLDPETTYTVKVRAYCAADDQSAWTDEITFTTLPTCVAPTNLTATNVTAHAATITWTAGADETAWQVMIDDNDENIVDVEDTPTYEMTELTPETQYSVKVRAYCDVDDQSAWVNVNFTTLVACPAPTALAAHLTPGNGTVATLTWTENGTATAWTLEYGTAADFTGATSMEVTETPSVDLTGLTAETPYYARVKTVCGGVDGESAWSSVINFTPTDAYSITLNDGTETNSYVPVYGLYVDDYSRSQFIIPASDLTALQGATITKLTYYSSTTSTDWGVAEFDVRLAEVENTAIESLATWDDMTLAYHGSLGISGNVMEVTFDTPYTYLGGNLMIGTNETVSGTYASCSWYGVSATGASMGGYGTSISQRNFLPKVTIDFIPGAPTYTITATAGENGSITPSGAVTVTEGSDKEFTITADENYRILSVVVDDADVTAAVVENNGVYTFTNVTANHTIAATFVAETAVTYTITASAGEHGNITPNGAVSVVEGEDQSFVITPDTDYRIDVLTVDGEVVTLSESEELGYVYAFTNVMAAHTINVTFTSLNNVEINAAASMAVYPNPNNGMFSIDFSNIEGDATYQLIDARGAVVETREINVTNGETKMFNHTLTAGTYFVRIINGDKVYVEQIVVE